MAGEIARLVEEEGYRYGDMAAFYRTNAQSRCWRTCSCGPAWPTGWWAGSGSTSAVR